MVELHSRFCSVFQGRAEYASPQDEKELQEIIKDLQISVEVEGHSGVERPWPEINRPATPALALPFLCKAPRLLLVDAGIIFGCISTFHYFVQAHRGPIPSTSKVTAKPPFQSFQLRYTTSGAHTDRAPRVLLSIPPFVDNRIPIVKNTTSRPQCLQNTPSPSPSRSCASSSARPRRPAHPFGTF